MSTEPASRNRYAAVLRTPLGFTAAALAVAVLVLAVVAPILWTDSANAVDTDDILAGPSSEHWAGTDNLGRDIIFRTLVATRLSIELALAATLIAIVVGVVLGSAPTVLGRRAGRLVTAGINIAVAFPGILLALFFTPLVARTVRGSVLAVKSQEYIDAARIRGERTGYILVGEILPNITGTLIVEATVRLSSAIVTAASLSFIGLGVQPPSPDWGLTIATEASYLTIAWWSAIFPSLALGSLVVGAALLAEGAREGNDR